MKQRKNSFASALAILFSITALIIQSSSLWIPSAYAAADHSSNDNSKSAVGAWGEVMDWPISAGYATLLNTGDVLLWDTWNNPVENALVWNPSTKSLTDVPPTISSSSGYFCCVGQATASSGDVLVFGGQTENEEGSKDIYSFNPLKGSWTPKKDMRYARWYPTATMLPDGKLLILSGQSALGDFVDTAEIINPDTNTTRRLTSFTTPELHEVHFPLTSLVPSGKVIAISTEQGKVMLYDPVHTVWEEVGITPRPNGVWTSFAPGEYLVTGGGEDFNSFSLNGPSQTSTQILDMASDVPFWKDGPDMHEGRSFHNVTMMADGKAFAIGGSETVDDYTQEGSLTAEAWDPESNTWTAMASPSASRVYHAVSVLLPDGRILSAGGDGEFNAQIFSPPYLFQGPRPKIASAPDAITHDDVIEITSPDAADITKITFTTLGSVTSSTDWNQHFMELQFTQSGNTLSVQTPTSKNIAPDGYYMLFLINSKGVPSEAKIIKLESAAMRGSSVLDERFALP